MKKIYNIIIKTFLCVIIFLVLAIICKNNLKLKNKIHYQLYQHHLSFSSIKSIYNKYLGGIIPLEINNSNEIKEVFKEKINYTGIEKYHDGAKLIVDEKYVVPNQEEGIVVYIGPKDNYGNVIIIENKDNIDIWYGNICNTTHQLYDYIKKGEYIGESCNNYIYIAYNKENNFLNYETYLK